MSSPVITVADQLSSDQVVAVDSALAAAEQADGTPPVNEAGRLALRHPHADLRHLLIEDGSTVVGYGQLEDSPTAPTAQLVVTPTQRRRGLGRALLDRLISEAVGPLQIWAMGNSPAAQHLAARTGLREQRALLIMERPLDDSLDQIVEPPIPDGVELRTFQPGRDEKAWLAVNAAAFADHPEQGRLTLDDLEQRMAEDWFDPAGFLVAESAEGLVGFHWTKQHHDHLGEVYVLGVAPAWSGRGLGKALLGAGLRHLRARGNTRVELYVEADHAGPVGLYRAYGFTEASRDVMYGAA